MNTFGNKISYLRKANKLSQTEPAKKLDTSTSVIARYEQGEMTSSIKVAKKVATILKTTVGYLLGETEQKIFLKTLIC